MGCGMPRAAGLQHRPHRGPALQAPDRRHRRDGQPLLRLVAQGDPHRRRHDPRRRGRRLHRRRRRVGLALHEAEAARPHAEPEAPGQGRPAQRVHRDGRDRRERRRAVRRHARGPGRVRQALAGPRRRRPGGRACSTREIVPVALPDGSDGRQGRRPARRARRSRSSPTLKPAFREGGTVTAGNACPLNDGAAATLIMSDDEGQGARPQAARPHHRRGHVAATSPSTWASPRSARSSNALDAPA